MNTSQISLIVIVAFIIYCVFFWRYDNFKNKERFEIYDQLSEGEPIYSKACCGNIFYPASGQTIDPNLNTKYYSSNISHLGDGDNEEGCRCLTQKELNYLNSRGGNNYDFNAVTMGI
jgi:preprotein translocase subunit YajC